MNPTLDVIRALGRALDEPHTRFASVQIVGTNGKTSTARNIEALLRAEGLRTGLTTSPALIDDRERILIDGQPLTQAQWDAYREEVQKAAESARTHDPDLPIPSDFELLTALAFVAFAAGEVDVAIVEAGIGGTWDATCVLNPAVVVYTSVSLEHTAILGDTIEAIARDKAGAIKPGSTVVLSDGVESEDARRIIAEKAEQVGATLLLEPHDRAQVSLIENLATDSVSHGLLTAHIPAYQYPNIKAAITAAEALLGRPLAPMTVPSVLETLTFPGRFEVLAREANGSATLLFDGAHNPEAACRLAQAVQAALDRGLLSSQPVIGLGVFDDKDLDGIIDALDPVAGAFLPLTAADPVRAVPREAIAGALARRSTKPVIDQWDRTSPLLVTGSLSLYETAQRFGNASSN